MRTAADRSRQIEMDDLQPNPFSCVGPGRGRERWAHGAGGALRASSLERSDFEQAGLFGMYSSLEDVNASGHRRMRRLATIGAVSVRSVQRAKDAAIAQFDEALEHAQWFVSNGFALFEDRAMVLAREPQPWHHEWRSGSQARWVCKEEEVRPRRYCYCYCLPRHRMPFNSTNEGSKRVSCPAMGMADVTRHVIGCR